MEPRGGLGERRPEKETTPEEGIIHPVTRMGKLRSVEPSQSHGVGAGTARDLGEFKSVGFTELSWHPHCGKKTDSGECWQGCGEIRALMRCWWEWKIRQLLRNQFLKLLNTELVTT